MGFEDGVVYVVFLDCDPEEIFSIDLCNVNIILLKRFYFHLYMFNTFLYVIIIYLLVYSTSLLYFIDVRLLSKDELLHRISHSSPRNKCIFIWPNLILANKQETVLCTRVN